MKYYDFICYHEESFDPCVCLVSFDSENWVKGRVKTNLVNIEVDITGSIQLAEIFRENIYRLEKLPMLEAKRKGIPLIFTEL